jgi:dCMP deaminase
MEKNWDEYFLNICKEVGKNTKCMSRQIGAILVNDKSIISTGYNGPPRGVPHCNQRPHYDLALREKLLQVGEESWLGPGDGSLLNDLDKCPRQAMKFRSGEGLHWCVAGHAERNVLINAARNGICTKGTIMYMDCEIPCSPCLIEIINSGVEGIVVTGLGYYDVSAEYLIKNSKLKVREFNL